MGLAAGKMEPFIVGGDYIDIRQFPHSIFLYVECMTTFVCGGSILSNRIVLTAAHCLYECLQGQENTIVLNYGQSSIYHTKTLLASNFLVHDNYKDNGLGYDIALLMISRSIRFGDTVKRVAILSRFPTRATGGYVTGWGVINSQMDRSINMKYVYQELQNGDMCHKVVNVPPGAFCARSEKSKEYPEQGDSGGAFVVYNFIQIGIVSFKHIEYDLIAYTNVTYYYKWIKNTAIRLSCTDKTLL